jgi:uncharacterized protein YjbI with pentapeptide repeats
MANAEHLELLQQGVDGWNAWREANSTILPNLHEANLLRANLSGANLNHAVLTQAYLRGANLRGANLSEAVLVGADLGAAFLSDANLSGADLDHAELTHAKLGGANLSGANLSEAELWYAKLGGANLSGANLSKSDLRYAELGGADLSGANLSGSQLLWANLSGANLSEANLSGANLFHAVLTQANLSGTNLSEAELTHAKLGGLNLSLVQLAGAKLMYANLGGANLSGANLSGADLTGANLREAVLVETDLANAVLNDCQVYGISAWNVRLSQGTMQIDLTITAEGEPKITVDNIEVAQFVYLLLHNEKIRNVIDTVTSKVVLILGRFTPDRKAVLDALRKELRLRGYVPILFDFEPSARRDITETVTLLARMSLFIIADLTEPSSIPKELEAIVPHLAVPVQPLLEGGRPYAMFTDYWKYDWVLPVHRYDGLDALLRTLADKVIVPAETKKNALAEKRRRFEAELLRPR